MDDYLYKNRPVNVFGFNTSGELKQKPRLYFDNIYIGYAATPIQNLVSLNARHRVDTRLGYIKGVLVKAPLLETFIYENPHRGWQHSFEFTGGERLPPFEELTLRIYEWTHSARDVSMHWDFSQIRSLKLVSVSMVNFLNSVDFDNFSQLQSFHINGGNIITPANDHYEITEKLYTLIGKHIRALRSLEIACSTALFPISALLAHATTLQNLRLRDFASFSGYGLEELPCISFLDLTILSRGMTALESLQLDIFIRSVPTRDARDPTFSVLATERTKPRDRRIPAPYLDAICAFPRLRGLSLTGVVAVYERMVTRHLILLADQRKVDLAIDAGKEMMCYLHDVKARNGGPMWNKAGFNVTGNDHRRGRPQGLEDDDPPLNGLEFKKIDFDPGKEYTIEDQYEPTGFTWGERKSLQGRIY